MHKGTLFTMTVSSKNDYKNINSLSKHVL